MKTEDRGNRYYLNGNTYPLRAFLKQWGFWYDDDLRQWWTTDKRAIDAVMEKCSRRARPTGPPPKKEDGPRDSTFDWRKNGLMCGRDSVHVVDDGATVRICVPRGHCTDMEGAIKLALSASGLCTKIETFSGSKRDTVYKLEDDGKWHAYGYD